MCEPLKVDFSNAVAVRSVISATAELLVFMWDYAADMREN